MAQTQQLTIAKVYAKAILDLATAADSAEAIDQELSEFVAYLKIEEDFRAFFESRIIDPAKRRASMDTMFRGKMSDLLLNTLHVLNDKDRTDIVTEIQLTYHQLFMAQQGIAEGQVTSATQLSDAVRGDLAGLLHKYSGKKIQLIEHVDPTILGGMIVRLDDHQVDLSVAHQLRRFHHTMIEHAEKQIHTGTSRFFEGVSE